METNMGSRTAVLLFLLQLTHILAKNVSTYFRLDGTLSLSPTAVPGPIKSILWRHEENLVAEWIKDVIDVQYYGAFVSRTELNINTGHLQITRATEADNGVFSVEINNVAQADRYVAQMVHNVPDPHVWVRPVSDQLYALYCDPVQGQGDALKAAEPVSYRWKIGTADWVEFGNKLEIEVDDTTALAKTFTCQMVNPVSNKTSKPVDNPFYGNFPVGAVAGTVGAGVVFVIIVLSVFAYKKKKCPCSGSGNAPVSPKTNDMETNKLNSSTEPETTPA